MSIDLDINKTKIVNASCEIINPATEETLQTIATNTSITPDYLIEVAKGNVPNASIINKFGINLSLSNSYVPVSVGAIYRTPQVSGAVTLRIRAGNVNDDVAGSGARQITVQGLSATGALQTETIDTAGTSASANIDGTWIRVFRAWVSASGTYATQSAGSHAADIVIEDTGGNAWGTISSTNFAKGQSQIGAYTVPLGYTAYLIDYVITMDTGKTVDTCFFKRENILETAAPYTAMRLLFQETGLTTNFFREFPDPVRIPALTDVGFMAKGATTPVIAVNFNLLLIED